MSRIDYKATVWFTANTNDIGASVMVRLIQRLKQGNISLLNALEELAIKLEFEQLLETEEPMSVEENQGNATIEIYGTNAVKPVWSNELK